MIRRNARLRREYLYKKSIRTTERDRLERKIRIREALEKGLPMRPQDLAEEAEEQEYGVDFVLDKEKQKKKMVELALDDEYLNATLQDPKIMITTSHDPSDGLRRFMKEISLIFPGAHRVNRGKTNNETLIKTATELGYTDLIMVNEVRGIPSTLIVCHLPFGPTAMFTMYNVVMRHDTDIQTKVKEAKPHLIFHNFKTKTGKRCATILKYLFPIPKEDSKRVMTFANNNDFISFRHHIFKKTEGKVLLNEIGPRFELMLTKITLGTFEQKNAETEWVLRPYMNTAHKRQVLGLSKEELEEQKERDLNEMRDINED
mmetsp:Transcript_8116/g.30098  ORF Transcript_8116/g.30098 Transcript_8116/m.30098 type:complete len:316 (-) Transcript_8116:79-1026(-)|eukprot:CAMPEP_0117445756 /NCGR_PEP_ID=MMETSP0759-20121206/5968_1 /TAXON_ID=63605 /ORGANISM="Percolomonas cosmopolitus, Strain WS" /LENGTH=315 /DNA_ID=CAMNT_0005237959 /DNA_START=94 /DNA_END=1041 /DNA_ORIENTATION=-